MTRSLTMLLTILSVFVGVTACATRVPASAPGVAARSSAAPAPTVTPSVFMSASIAVMPKGGPNPQETIPNPGASPGNPLLAQALLPQSKPARPAQLSPGVVALPDRDLGSLFLGLRQYGSPVIGPHACDEWTAGLSAAVLANFNQAGVQLGVEHGGQTPGFAETIITGPPSVLDALANPPLPAACRDITTPHYSGGVQPIAAPVPGAASARAFEITGTGKPPVWMWAEVVKGRNFVLEIRIPVQSDSPNLGVTLSPTAAAAYNRATRILT